MTDVQAVLEEMVKAPHVARSVIWDGNLDHLRRLYQQEFDSGVSEDTMFLLRHAVVPVVRFIYGILLEAKIPKPFRGFMKQVAEWDHAAACKNLQPHVRKLLNYIRHSCTGWLREESENRTWATLLVKELNEALADDVSGRRAMDLASPGRRDVPIVRVIMSADADKSQIRPPFVWSGTNSSARWGCFVDIVVPAHPDLADEREAGFVQYSAFSRAAFHVYAGYAMPRPGCDLADSYDKLTSPVCVSSSLHPGGELEEVEVADESAIDQLDNVGVGGIGMVASVGPSIDVADPGPKVDVAKAPFVDRWAYSMYTKAEGLHHTPVMVFLHSIHPRDAKPGSAVPYRHTEEQLDMHRSALQCISVCEAIDTVSPKGASTKAVIRFCAPLNKLVENAQSLFVFFSAHTVYVTNICGLDTTSSMLQLYGPIPVLLYLQALIKRGELTHLGSMVIRIMPNDMSIGSEIRPEMRLLQTGMQVRSTLEVDFAQDAEVVSGIARLVGNGGVEGVGTPGSQAAANDGTSKPLFQPYPLPPPGTPDLDLYDNVDKVMKKIQATKLILIYGDAGAGKSTLADLVARKALERHKVGFALRIDASDEALIADQFLRWSHALPGKKVIPDKAWASRVVYEALADRYKVTMLIFDGYDPVVHDEVVDPTPRLEQRWLPPISLRSHFVTIVTSRANGWSKNPFRTSSNDPLLFTLRGPCSLSDPDECQCRVLWRHVMQLHGAALKLTSELGGAIVRRCNHDPLAVHLAARAYLHLDASHRNQFINNLGEMPPLPDHSGELNGVARVLSAWIRARGLDSSSDAPWDRSLLFLASSGAPFDPAALVDVKSDLADVARVIAFRDFRLPFLPEPGHAAELRRRQQDTRQPLVNERVSVPRPVQQYLRLRLFLLPKNHTLPFSGMATMESIVLNCLADPLRRVLHRLRILMDDRRAARAAAKRAVDEASRFHHDASLAGAKSMVSQHSSGAATAATSRGTTGSSFTRRPASAVQEDLAVFRDTMLADPDLPWSLIMMARNVRALYDLMHNDPAFEVAIGRDEVTASLSGSVDTRVAQLFYMNMYLRFMLWHPTHEFNQRFLEQVDQLKDSTAFTEMFSQQVAVFRNLPGTHTYLTRLINEHFSVTEEKLSLVEETNREAKRYPKVRGGMVGIRYFFDRSEAYLSRYGKLEAAQPAMTTGQVHATDATQPLTTLAGTGNAGAAKSPGGSVRTASPGSGSTRRTSQSLRPDAETAVIPCLKVDLDDINEPFADVVQFVVSPGKVSNLFPPEAAKQPQLDIGNFTLVQYSYNQLIGSVVERTSHFDNDLVIYSVPKSSDPWQMLQIRKFRHPLLTPLMAVWQDETHVRFVYPCMCAMERSKPTPQPESVVRRCIFALIAVMQFFHSHNVPMVDVGPENILLDPTRRRVRISDPTVKFIFSKIDNINLRAAAASKRFFAAPELKKSRAAQTKPVPADALLRSDIYSVGTTMYFMLTGQAMPSDGISNWSPLVGEDARQLILGLTDRTPSSRMSLERAKTHSFFRAGGDFDPAGFANGSGLALHDVEGWQELHRQAPQLPRQSSHPSLLRSTDSDATDPNVSRSGHRARSRSRSRSRGRGRNGADDPGTGLAGSTGSVPGSLQRVDNNPLPPMTERSAATTPLMRVEQQNRRGNRSRQSSRTLRSSGSASGSAGASVASVRSLAADAPTIRISTWHTSFTSEILTLQSKDPNSADFTVKPLLSLLVRLELILKSTSGADDSEQPKLMVDGKEKTIVSLRAEAMDLAPPPDGSPWDPDNLREFQQRMWMVCNAVEAHFLPPPPSSAPASIVMDDH